MFLNRLSQSNVVPGDGRPAIPGNLVRFRFFPTNATVAGYFCTRIQKEQRLGWIGQA